MTQLLQKLLNDRDDVLLLYKKWTLCSCGQKFDDYTDAENHLVLSHPRHKPSASRDRLSDISRCCNRNIDNQQLEKPHGRNLADSSCIAR